MIAVLIIPTGIGCPIGGHAGDANPVAKLIGACCDKVILHPNVVNASDINEMPENALYVDGSMLDRFLEGAFQLEEVRHQNRIIVVVNSPVTPETVNAVSAARATVGINASIVELDTPLMMTGTFGSSGKADGSVWGVRELAQQLAEYTFDALAVHTPITVTREAAMFYHREGGVNPWGGVEAIASRDISCALDNKPVAHAPLENMDEDDIATIVGGVADPRLAAEVISSCYLHSVLKGLNRAPKAIDHITGAHISRRDVGCLISPAGCWGRPHTACQSLGIPIIQVEENQRLFIAFGHAYRRDIVVKNYWEAAGVIMSMRAGIDRMSVRRPLEETQVMLKLEGVLR